jgi:NADH-quinone oxidoreductase subunit M
MIYEEVHWTAQAGLPLLAILQLLPLALAALVIAVRNSKLVVPISVIGALAEFLLSLHIYTNFEHDSAALQFAERYEFFGAFHYHAAVDGISVLFILLTTFLTFIIVLYGRIIPMEPVWRLMGLGLAVESALTSQFVTMNILWFTLASAMQMLLVGYLLWGWATSAEKDLALIRYLQFMGVGLILLLAGFAMLGWNFSELHNGRWSFDLFELASAPIQAKYQSIIFFLVFYGLAIRIPLFPLHGWLPLTAEHGTVAVAPVFLLGLKTGVYGFLRFIFPLMEGAVLQWHKYVVAFAVAGVFYAAVLALMQVNMRRLLAYAVVSHTGILVIGLFSLGHTAFEGGILLSVNFGLAIAGLLFMTGIVYTRTRTMLLARLGDLFDRLPIIGTAFLVAGLSIIGMPGTPGFDSVHLVLGAAIERFGAVVTITAALGNVVAAGFLLRAFQHAFLAPRQEAVQIEIAPARTLERLIAVTFIAILLTVGFYSEPWLQLIERSLDGLSTLYGTAL